MSHRNRNIHGCDLRFGNASLQTFLGKTVENTGKQLQLKIQDCLQGDPTEPFIISKNNFTIIKIGTIMPAWMVR